MPPLVSVILCTVRPTYGAFAKEPERHLFASLFENLRQQTDQRFELIIVDGLYGQREMPVLVSFPLRILPPLSTPWTRTRQWDLCAYRNAGIAAAQGEVIVQIDDCMDLPPSFVQLAARAHEHGRYIAFSWPQGGDHRLQVGEPARPAVGPNEVFSIISYPRAAAFAVNGLDAAWGGARGLEDIDFSTRLWAAGLRWILLPTPGLALQPQGPYDERALLNGDALIGRCCNWAWETQRVLRQVVRANTVDLWDDPRWLSRIAGPCQFMHEAADGSKLCRHHQLRNACPYTHLRLPFDRDPRQMVPPVLDLRVEAERLSR